MKKNDIDQGSSLSGDKGNDTNAEPAETSKPDLSDIETETGMPDPSLPNRNIGKEDWDREDLKRKTGKPLGGEEY